MSGIASDSYMAKTWKSWIWENVYRPLWAQMFPMGKEFYGKHRGNSNESDILVFDSYNEICQHLKDFHNWLNIYFPNDQHMVLQNNARGMIQSAK